MSSIFFLQESLSFTFLKEAWGFMSNLFVLDKFYVLRGNEKIKEQP